MTFSPSRDAHFAVIAAKLQLEITDQQLKKTAVMQNANTLRRILSGQNYYFSHLLEAVDGVNCEIEITIKRRDRS